MKDGKDNKKKKRSYIYIDMFFICRYKMYELKFYQITLYIHELCDPLNPSHLMYTFLRSTFFTRYTSG